MSEYKSHNCRVCGLYSDDLPWGEDGVSPTYIICNCCGVEFGYEDYTIESTKEYREEWIKRGVSWFFPKARPIYWSLDDQLMNIPDEFK